MEAFFMFHRGLGSNDEDATVSERTEKLLFYSSACDDDLDEQLERVSMCEAFIDVCRSFQADAPVDSVFLDDHQYSMVECEPDTWLVVCCKNGVRELAQWKWGESSYSTYQYLSSSVSEPQKRSPIQKIHFRTSNKKNIKEKRDPERKYKRGEMRSAGLNTAPHIGPRLYEGDSPNAKVCNAVMRQFYAILVLFYGRVGKLLCDEKGGLGSNVPKQIMWLRKRLRKSRKLQELVDEGNLDPDAEQQAYLDSRRIDEDSLANHLAVSPADKLRQRLLPFVPFFLEHIDFMRLHILYDVRVLPFLSVGKSTFLSTQLFMQKLKDKFQNVVQSGMLLYNGEALWSSLPREQVEPIYTYLDMFTNSLASQGTEIGSGSNSVHYSKASGIKVLNLKPGFLGIGHTVEHSKAFATAADGTDVNFSQVHNVHTNQVSRMAVYGHGKALLVILIKDVEERDDSEWNKTSLLEFAGNFEAFVSPELARLADAIAFNIAAGTKATNATVSSSNSLFFVPYMSTAPSVIGASEINNAGSFSQHKASGADGIDRYIFLNEDKSVVKISDAWLNALTAEASSCTSTGTASGIISGNSNGGSSGGPSGFGDIDKIVKGVTAYPSRVLFGKLLPSNLVCAMNDIRTQFDLCPAEDILIINFVRPCAVEHHPGCWVAALKSLGRQIFLVVDAKHTFEYVSYRLRLLRETTFRSILL